MKEFQGEDPGNGGGARFAEQSPPDHGSGEDSLKSFYISRVSITVVLSYNTLMIQEISDLDDHIGILK